MTLSEKLLEVQKTIEKATKSSTNPHFKSKYADLNEVLSVAKPSLNGVGVFVAQSPGKDAFGQYVETSLIDSESGQQLSGKVYFSGNEDNLQKIGAAITYARRFGLVSLLSLESEDDDGETVVGRPAPSKAPTKAPQAAAPAPKTPLPPVPATGREAVKGAQIDRAKLNEKIGLAAKVLMDSKRATEAELVGMLSEFKASNKEELSDADAGALYTKLQGRLK